MKKYGNKYGNKKGIDAAHYMTASIHYLKCSTSDRKNQYGAAAWNYDLNIKNSKKMPPTRCVIYLLGSPAKRESS